MLGSLSEEIQKFDNFFNENSLDLSPYDVRHTQAATVEIKEKFVVLQDLLKPKKKFGFKSKCKKVNMRQSLKMWEFLYRASSTQFAKFSKKIIFIHTFRIDYLFLFFILEYS